jgi:hypothetical protein
MLALPKESYFSIKSIVLIAIFSCTFFPLVTLLAQTKIKEKIAIKPSAKIKPVRESLAPRTSFSVDTVGTLITVKYYYRACEGFGVVRTTQSPCNDAYKDSATGNYVTDVSQQGLAVLQFTAYDAGLFTFLADPHFVCPAVLGTCFITTCNDSIVVTDNRGSPPIKGTGVRPSVVYQAPAATNCVVTNSQPQQFDTTSFEIYKQGDQFTSPSLPQPIIVDNCGYGLNPGFIQFGLTLPLWYVNMNKQPPYYNTALDIQNIPHDPQVCIDNTQPGDPRWIFKYKTKVRIPIFSSLCPPNGFTDLGSDSIAWQSTITSCPIYKRAWDAMVNYWLPGSYVSGGGTPPYHYYFGGMVVAHENTHVEKMKDSIESAFNRAYQEIFNNRPSALLFACAKNAIDNNPMIGSDIPNNFNKATSQKPKASQAADEIATDTDPRTRAQRQKIFDEFKAWGRSKGWVNQNGNIQCP